MSMKKERKEVLPTSTRPARKKMKKIPQAPQERSELPLTQSAGNIISKPLPSPLAELYKSEDFKSEWANDVRFHIASNVIELRKYRRMSQSAVAKAMGTSQSAVARIENGLENLTADTLERLIKAMNGRFYVSIHPKEFALPKAQPWWEIIGTPAWSFRGAIIHKTATLDQVILGMERPRDTTSIGYLPA